MKELFRLGTKKHGTGSVPQEKNQIIFNESRELTVNSFRIKACNPDNEVETGKLVELFRAAFGEQYPFRGVYEREYWARNVGRRFMSLLATRRHSVLAHLAARPEPGLPGIIQLTFPACAPDFQAHAIDAARECWSVFRSIAERQSWTGVYYAAFSDVELTQRLATEVFQSSPSAVLPGYIPVQNPRCSRSKGSGARTPARSHVVLTERRLTETQSTVAPLYVPRRHRDLVSELLTDSGATHSRGRMCHVVAKSHQAIAADVPAIERRVMRDWNSVHMLVHPRLLANFEDAILASTEFPEARPYLFVNARDSHCIQFCEYLESQGLAFCGMTSSIFSTETLVYAYVDELSMDPEHFICPSTRRLARYISEQDSVGLPRPLPAKIQERFYVTTRA